MKKILVLALVLSFVSLSLLAQELEVNVNIDEELEEAMQELDEAMEEISIISIERKSSDTPKMGVYLSDLDFQDAYEMHYPACYGVYVSGVVPGGPSDNAGIIKDDIIMEFDGKKVRFEDHLVTLIKSKNIGDEVEVVIFRSEEILSTKVSLGTLHPKKDKDIIITKDGKTKKRYSVGHGGGSWLPIWYTPDIAEINDVLASLDFKDETFSEDGFLLQGGGGKGNVGKGWFIGGMGAGYSNKESSKHFWWDNDGILDSTLVSRKAKYAVSYWGATLDKRYSFSKKFIGSVGFMLGAGQNFIKVTQTVDNGDIPNFNFETGSSQQMDDFYNFKSKLTMKKDYIVFQPKVMLMYHFLDWLAFRAEVGYLVSYSPNDCTVKRNGETVKALNAPESNMDGLTLTVGPWFGF